MNKKKRKNKKLGSLLLLLFLTIILLSTSTYAWFTANKTVKISDIDVNVATSSGLQISTDAVNWKTVISSTDITDGYTAGSHTDINMLSSAMVPVSTAGTATTGLLNMYNGTVVAGESDGIFRLTASKITEAKTTTGEFIAFDIFLKLDNASPVYIEKGSGVVFKEGTADKKLQYASRIALVVQGTGQITDTQETLVGYNAASKITILEPNYDGHADYGIVQGNLYYTDYTYPGGGLTAGTGNGYVSYDGVSAAITTGIPLANTNATDNPTYFSTVSTVHLTDAFSKGDVSENNYEWYSTASPFPAGITKVRVYMWIEGQDIDCENNASGSDLTFKLSFTLNS